MAEKSDQEPQPDIPFSIKGLQIIGTLGEGSFGKVLLVRPDTLTATEGSINHQQVDRTDAFPRSQLMACKILSKDTTHNLAQQQLQSQNASWEMWVMKFLSERAFGTDTPVVRFLGVFESSDGRPCTAMELFRGGSLLRMMQSKWRRGRNMTGRQAAPVFYQATKALLFSHQNHILHLDVKPENILLHDPGNPFTACLADFGLALPFVPTAYAGANHPYTVIQTCAGRGTPGYCAPEVHTDGILSTAADTWSLGAMLLEMLTGELPPEKSDALLQWWSDPEGKQLEEDLRHSVPGWKRLDHMAQHLLLAMLCPHFCNRLPLQQVVSHPWLINNLMYPPEVKIEQFPWEGMFNQVLI